MSRLRAFILISIFLLLTAFGLSRITLNVDVLALLPADLPEVKGLKVFYQQFNRPNELIVTLEGDAAESAAQALAQEFAKHPELVQSAVWNLPLQDDPEVAADLLAYLWINTDPAETKALLARLAPSHIESELAQVIEELSSGLPDQKTYLRAYDPLGLVAGLPSGLESAGLDPSAADAAFASADQHFRVLYVKAPKGQSMDYKTCALWLAEIQALVENWKNRVKNDHPDWAALELAYTGEPAFVAEIGSTMERDMNGSISTTMLLICLLFWIMHRRLLPLLWLVGMLVVTFGLTLAIASLVIGELSIMSVGFAAILIGLTIDYGVVLYKEARFTPGDPVALRRLMGPSILWAASTTGAVFFALQFSSFPGIAQLGTLVAIGVLVGSVVMLLFYSPVATWAAAKQQSIAVDPPERVTPAARTTAWPVWVTGLTLALPLLSLLLLLALGLPGFEKNFKPMQVRDSPSMAATERMQNRLSQGAGQQPLVIEAASLDVLPQRMKIAQGLLAEAVASGGLAEFVLPEGLLPNLQNQQKNRPLLESLLADEKRLATAVEKAGFTPEALALTRPIFAAWRDNLQGAGEALVLPQQHSSRWLMERLFSSNDEGSCFVLVAVTAGEKKAAYQVAVSGLALEGIHITGWHTLDPAIQRLIKRDSLRVFLPVALALLVMLFFIFRDWRDLVLSLVTLLFSFGVLLALSSLLKIEWNAFSLSSVPILFGVGLDYSIHMIFALRRSEGNLQVVRAGISRAILFCGFSTAIGFASLSFASNLGLASIGRICGLGVLIIMLTTLVLLPYWWRRLRVQNTVNPDF